MKGTRNYDGQIAKNTEKRQITKVLLRNLFKETSDIQVKVFISEFLIRHSSANKCSILNQVKCQINQLPEYEIELLRKHNFTNLAQIILTCQRDWINYKS